MWSLFYKRESEGQRGQATSHRPQSDAETVRFILTGWSFIHSFIQYTLRKHLLRARHCSKRTVIHSTEQNKDRLLQARSLLFWA